MVTIAAADRVDRDGLLEFVRGRHRFTLMTTRQDGRPHLSPVTGGVDEQGRLVVSTYPDRAKAVHLRRDPSCSVLVHSDDWNGSYVQVYGTAEVLDMYPHETSGLPRSTPPPPDSRGGTEGVPSSDAEEGLVDYFRCISGEHPDWDEYRDAMRRQGKSLIRVSVTDWGPVAHGGFPADRAPA